ncbi:urease accessory protein UreD [Streptomyces oryzae]|uniref:Urease accessory protein UreD n=1 Tax=Streptomyces oryzae TaxID=1434886 RepID=A0ABS3X9E0_9ACTN|nr:urease accessory protein UreD [Streptomyces oryzae]MBO8191983.1 urease accessory protein UreD [Streptomyces oryzae]
MTAPAAAGATAAAPPPASGVSARARIAAEPDGRGGTALPLLSGAGPVALRRTRSADPAAARVTLVGAMSAPLGGDRLAVETRVAAGAALRVDGSAATLALPGRTGEPARYDVRLEVGEEGRLHWLPEPLISVRGSELRQRVSAELAPGARLVVRDEQVLGRTGEGPGRLSSRLTVRRGGRPLLDQQLDFGPGALGWDGGAALGGYRAVGQLLVVGPELTARKPEASRVLGDTAVVTPLVGPALLVTAVAPDALQLRRTLDSALTFTSW